MKILYRTVKLSAKNLRFINVDKVSNFGAVGDLSDNGNVGNVGKVSNISAVGDGSDKSNIGQVSNVGAVHY